MSAQLREIRKGRDWSQSQLVRAIEIYARHHSIALAGTASLNVYVSEWENGKRPLRKPYIGILRALLGVTDDELLGRPTVQPPNADGYDELLTLIDTAQGVGGVLVDAFYQQTELLRTFDRQRGARSIVDPMQTHLNALQDALTFAVLPSSRKPVASALAGAATLAAWQALDVGSVTRAWQHYETAKSAARDAESKAYLAHSMDEQAYVLLDAGRSALALSLVREAQAVGAQHISPRLTAWLYAAEAEVCAHAGLADDCRRALDRALRILPPGQEPRDPEMLSIFLNEDHLARWRGNVLARIGDADAIASLHTALEKIDPTFIRARAGLFCDLAQAHTARGESDQAADFLLHARRLATQTGSARHLQRINRLTTA